MLFWHEYIRAVFTDDYTQASGQISGGFPDKRIDTQTPRPVPIWWPGDNSHSELTKDRVGKDVAAENICSGTNFQDLKSSFALTSCMYLENLPVPKLPSLTCKV